MKLNKDVEVSDKPYSEARIKIILALKSQDSYAFYWTSLMGLLKPKDLCFRLGISINLLFSMEELFKDWEKFDAILITEWDHEFKADTLKNLWDNKKPVVCGLYRSRHAEGFPYLVAEENPYRYITGFPEKELFTVESTGTGFMLLRKEAIAKLKKPFIGMYKNGLDRFLCRRIRKANMNIWIDPKIRIGHYISKIIY